MAFRCACRGENTGTGEEEDEEKEEATADDIRGSGRTALLPDTFFAFAVRRFNCNRVYASCRR